MILDEPDEGGEILSESEDGGQKKNKMKRPSVHVEADDLMGDRVIANELMKSCLSKTWAGGFSRRMRYPTVESGESGKS